MRRVLVERAGLLEGKGGVLVRVAEGLEGSW